MVRIIGIVSAKGGVGKTTVASNIGIALAKMFGRNVAAIDCNLTTPHLGLVLGLYTPVLNFNSVLRNECGFEQVVQRHKSGLNIVPASLGLDDLQGVSTDGLNESLKTAFGSMDVVLLDSSPGLGREALITIQNCDEVLFVATPHISSIIDVTKAYQLVRQMQKSPIGIVLNRVKGSTYELSDTEINRLTGLPVIAKIPEDENILKSTNARMPVVLMSPKSSSSVAFCRLAAELAGEEYKPRGFWLKFLKIFKFRGRTLSKHNSI